MHCGKRFELNIPKVEPLFKNGDFIFINVQWFGEITHSKIVKPQRIYGKKRSICALSVLADGAQLHRSKMIIHNKENGLGEFPFT